VKGKKRKRRGRRRGLARGVANGPLGQKGREASFFFFSQTLFKSNFSFQIQTKILQTFLQNFINFLEVTQATKNHAKPNNDAQPLVVSTLIKLSLIF
jgi:hypothetical protein